MVNIHEHKEGWGVEKPYHKKKYCYFINGEALCGGWAFYNGELSQDGDDHPENCKKCQKKLKKLKESHIGVREDVSGASSGGASSKGRSD